MYKILLVDDDMWVRRSLAEQINWQVHNAQLAGEAEDGEEAFGLALRLRPDIILTDIKMPHIDGIELMELVNKNLPAAKIIVISSYSEFEFVRSAVVNKAINYILKPIRDDDLNAAIATAIREIRDQEIKDTENQALKDTISISNTILKEKYMNAVISDNHMTNEKFKSILSHINITFDYSHCQIMIINIANYSQLLKEDFQNDDILFGSAIGSLLDKSLDSSRNISFRSAETPGNFIVLIGHSTNPAGSSHQPDSIAASEAENITAVLKTHANAAAQAGIGSVYDCGEGITRSFLEAKYALQYNNNTNHLAILFYENVHKRGGTDNMPNKVAEYINTHYSEPITLESVAEKFYTNSSYLSRIFKNVYNENFISYLTRIRMEKALLLMDSSNLKISEISQMVGFKDMNYFSKAFKKFTGFAPTDYKNNNKL